MEEDRRFGVILTVLEDESSLWPLSVLPKQWVWLRGSDSEFIAASLAPQGCAELQEQFLGEFSGMPDCTTQILGLSQDV